MRFALAALVAAAPVGAEPVTLLDCPIGAKRLTVTADAEAVTYRFGAEGAPELTLTNPLSASSFQPWPGVGRSIFESIRFENESYAYEAFWSFDRLEPEGDMAGGVVVLKEENIVATLDCDAGQVEATFFTMEDHLREAGICWDYEAREHRPCAQ